jgi:signal transduction histidine kinase
MIILQHLFATDGFMPHGHCYLWKPGLVWLHVVSDILIWLSYVTISTTLVYLVRRIRGMPFQWMYVAFGVFIIACGFTHFMEVWTVWRPVYWLAGGVKVVTAVASLATALLLPTLIPKAVALAHAARVSQERGVKLEAAHAAMSVLLEKTREIEQLKTQFFANVSHELRTPLTLIIGPTEKLLTRDDLSEAQRNDLETVDRNARRLLRYVNDILDVTKLEAGHLAAAYAETDLTRLVRLTCAQFDTIASERHIAYDVHTPPSLPSQVDPEKIERVLTNILSNALEFTPDGGRIECALQSVSSPGGEPMARLTVSDSGPGVPAELRGAIFERFRQAESDAPRRFGGTGLGLAIAKEFVELHRGAINIDDAPQGGARFVVDLPLTAPAGTSTRPATRPTNAATQTGRQPHLPSRATSDAARTAESAHATQPTGGVNAAENDRALVLVVDDNADIRRFLADTLSTDFRVALASNGAEGVQTARALRPDLIVSDVMMPEKTGVEMVTELRSESEFDGTPVVFLTAKADDALRIRMLQNGAQDYVMKPFSGDELRARVRNLASMKRTRDILRRELATQLGDVETLAQELADSRRELAGALETMRVARDQALYASQAKSRFLSLVSHELRTPLTTLDLQLQLLQRDMPRLTPRQQEMVTRMMGASARLLDLIESLLEYTRVESGRLAVRIEPIDLPALAEEVADDLRPRAEKRGLELRLRTAFQIPPLECDRRLVRLILVNLVENALKYTERGFVEVSTHADGAHHHIRVEDSGCGIPLHSQTRVFEPFEQVEPISHKHSPGVGLGLALVREVVDSLGGSIELRSVPERGSIFAVTLPSRAEVDVEAASA